MLLTSKQDTSVKDSEVGEVGDGGDGEDVGAQLGRHRNSHLRCDNGNKIGFVAFVNFVQFPFLLGIKAEELHWRKNSEAQDLDDDFHFFTIAFQFPLAGSTLPAPESDEFLVGFVEQKRIKRVWSKAKFCDTSP